MENTGKNADSVSVEAFLGMKVFHHKTLHISFRFLVPCALIVWILFLAWLSGQGVIVMG